MGWLIQHFKAIQHEYLAQAVGTIVFHADVTRMSEQMLHRKNRFPWKQMRLPVRSGSYLKHSDLKLHFFKTVFYFLFGFHFVSITGEHVHKCCNVREVQ